MDKGVKQGKGSAPDPTRAIILVKALVSFQINCLFDPSSTFVGFSVQNSGGWPTDHVVVMRCMVSQC